MRYILTVVGFILLVLCVSPASSAIYKWVDEKGNVHFTDTPPEQGGSQVVNPAPNVVEGYGKVSGDRARKPAVADTEPAVPSADLPIVEMFVTSWCGYCRKAEAWFNARDIPYVKYDIEKDKRAARRKASLTQSRGVPFILIGEVGIPGYSEAAFEKALRQYK